MILAATDNPIEVWQDAERYLIDGARTYSPFSGIMEVGDRYRPDSPLQTFPLKSFWISPPDGTYLQNDASSELHQMYFRQGRILFVVHPEILEIPTLPFRSVLLASPAGPTIDVVPSASTRTVFVNKIGGVETKCHFLKLHFPRRISRFFRPLHISDIENQLWATAQLAKAGLPVLRDIAGAVVGDTRGGGWGYLVRESIPANIDSPGFTVPLFSLYSRDLRFPHDPVLLAQLVEPHRARELIETIVKGMIRLWFEALDKTGCLIEPHAQNTLFMFSSARNHWQVAYRDGGVYVDPSTSRKSMIELPPTPDLVPEAIDRGGLLSLTYDTFLGHHALGFLSRAAQETFGLDRSFVRDLAKQTFRDLGGSQLRMPKTVFAFDRKLYSDEDFNLVDTGEVSEWR